MFEHSNQQITINDLSMPLEFFQTQKPGYRLPEGAIGVTYVPGVMHVVKYDDRSVGGETTWDEGDTYIKEVEQYRTAWLAQQAQAPPKAIESTSENYRGFYNGLLGEAINLFLFVRSMAKTDPSVALAYTDLMGSILIQQLPGFQSSITELFASLQSIGSSFSEEQIVQMRDLLDRNGFEEIVFPLGAP